MERIDTKDFQELSSKIAANITRGRVREVMTNDFGFTRDEIRLEAEGFIREIAQKHVAHLITNNYLTGMIEREVAKVVEKERVNIQNAVGSASAQATSLIKQEISNLVNKNLKIQLNVA